MNKNKQDSEICICGETFIVEPYMRELEAKLCANCFKREAYIILLIQRTKQLKRERRYPVNSLIRMAEYHATKRKLTN